MNEDEIMLDVDYEGAVPLKDFAINLEKESPKAQGANGVGESTNQ